MYNMSNLRQRHNNTASEEVPVEEEQQQQQQSLYHDMAYSPPPVPRVAVGSGAMNLACRNSSLMLDITDGDIANIKSGTGTTPLSASGVHKAESSMHKILVRVLFGTILFTIFGSLVYAGHVHICGLIVLIEVLLFRELVRVRYSAYFESIKDTVPLFRTTQWMWFVTAVFYTYGAFLVDILQRNRNMHYLLPYMQYFHSVNFLLYSGTFVLTIATLKRETIKFQLNQLCWTILVRAKNLVLRLQYTHQFLTHTHFDNLDKILIDTNTYMHTRTHAGYHVDSWSAQIYNAQHI